MQSPAVSPGLDELQEVGLWALGEGGDFGLLAESSTLNLNRQAPNPLNPAKSRNPKP